MHDGLKEAFNKPIESTLTVRQRTKRTKGSLSRKTGLAMAIKLMMSARKNGENATANTVCPRSSKGLSSAIVYRLRQLQVAA